MAAATARRRRWHLAFAVLQAVAVAASNMSVALPGSASEEADLWPIDAVIRRLVMDFVDQLNIDYINFIIEDAVLLRTVCVTATRELYTARRRACHITCSRLLGDWAASQHAPLAAGLTVSVLPGSAGLAGHVLYLMQRRRFSEQMLLVTDGESVPAVPVENSHWYQARLATNSTSAVIKEAWTFPYDPAPIVETRGTWSLDNGLYLCPQLAKGPTSFQGRTLRVGIVNDSYVTMERLKNGEIKLSGFLAILLRFLEERLNFRSEVHIPAKHIVRPNGTQPWGGMLGDVYHRRLELGLAAFAIVEERRPLVDFTPHIESTHHSFLIRDPTLALPDDEVNWAAYLSPFALPVWLALLVVAVLAWLAATVIMRALSGPVDTHSSAADSAWIVTGVMLQQGTGVQPATLSARQAMICLWMLSILLYTAYTSNIVSLLASNRFAMPFSTLQELKNLKDWKILIRENGFEYQFLQKVQYFESERFVFIENSEAGIERVLLGGKYVLFSPVVNIEATVEADCRLIWAPIKLAYRRGHAILQKDLPYGDRISNAIQVLGEAGIIAETWRKETEKKRHCTETNALPAMSLRHTLPAFSLLLLGILVSAAVLVAERLCRRSAARSWQYRPRRHRRSVHRCPSVVITSPEPPVQQRHLSADRDCHLAADNGTNLPPSASGDVNGNVSAVEMFRPLSSAASSVAEVLACRVQALVHRRAGSGSGRARNGRVLSGSAHAPEDAGRDGA